MKIQCEFCYKDEASVFCSADEAALCHGCDHRVHHANKLAGKHHRFSLLPPSLKHLPLCDICQEKRAFLFCQEDRAVLCKDCDVPIHKANEHTQKHNRFLLTGVKLSPMSSLYSSSSSSSSSVMDGCDVVPHLPTQKSSNKPTSLPPPVILNNPPSLPKVPTNTTTIVDKFGKNNQVMNGVGNGSASSISEYLIEMLPGWHVEDFLDSSSTPSTFLKTGDSDLMSFWDAELEGTLSSFSSEKMGFLVPQAPSSLLSTSFSQSNMGFDGTVDFKDTMEAQAANKIKTSRKWRDNGCFNVPQISPPSTTSKRSRTSWY